MKIKSYFFALISIVFVNTATAETLNFQEYFRNTQGCFILYDVNQHKIVQEYDSKRCAQKISPASTFKIALSLMAFDQKLITQKTIFKWDNKDRGLVMWNQDQTPQTWLLNSAVWVSQKLTLQLGMPNIKNYLKKFHYGNQNFSGDPGKHNGLTQAWLSSSLKISADEQLRFLKKLVNNQLPVSQDAMIQTKKNMYLETSPHGWLLYGKTGSGSVGQKLHQYFNKNQVPQLGWFEGFLQRDNQTYIFVVNFSDVKQPDTREGGGIRAKKIAKDILSDLKIF